MKRAVIDMVAHPTTPLRAGCGPRASSGETKRAARTSRHPTSASCGAIGVRVPTCMAPIIPNPKAIKSFRTAAAFEAWMRTHHDRAPELWIRVYKKASGVPTVTTAEALDVALCWGWIDGIRKGLDEDSFLQRYTPRRRKSVWSQINRDHVARLVAAGRMTPHGLRQVEAAKADGRWDAAYAPIRASSEATIPADLRAAIKNDARAERTFRTLGKQNLFALAFRTNQLKTAAGRAKKIADWVAMLARGETITPEKNRAPTPPAPPKAKGRRSP
jgi:uncharacterized protein YdeI (YjbR/CyaY-like superfamily)